MGIGGGGDVVGALAAAELLGGGIVGGLTWERRPVDPVPGPRTLDEVAGAQRLNDAVAMGARVPDEHWRYCSEAAAASRDIEVQELFMLCARAAPASSKGPHHG